MVSEASYRIRRPEVVSERFEGEAVVVNLRVGRYYALSPLASELWARLEAAPRPEALVAASVDVWSDPAVAERELQSFLDRLVAEELIERVEGLAGSDMVEPLPPLDDPRLEFEAFDDLQDLLVLDPIHDLDEDGWPAIPDPADLDGGR